MHFFPNPKVDGHEKETKPSQMFRFVLLDFSLLRVLETSPEFDPTWGTIRKELLKVLQGVKA